LIRPHERPLTLKLLRRLTSKNELEHFPSIKLTPSQANYKGTYMSGKKHERERKKPGP